jgi:hypothetical protein
LRQKEAYDNGLQVSSNFDCNDQSSQKNVALNEEKL